MGRGGRWLREKHGILSLPLMVQPNTALPLGKKEDRPDYEYADGVVYHVFELDEGVPAAAQVARARRQHRDNHRGASYWGAG